MVPCRLDFDASPRERTARGESTPQKIKAYLRACSQSACAQDDCVKAGRFSFAPPSSTTQSENDKPSCARTVKSLPTTDNDTSCDSCNSVKPVFGSSPVKTKGYSTPTKVRGCSTPPRSPRSDQLPIPVWASPAKPPFLRRLSTTASCTEEEASPVVCRSLILRTPPRGRQGSRTKRQREVSQQTEDSSESIVERPRPATPQELAIGAVRKVVCSFVFRVFVCNLLTLPWVAQSYLGQTTQPAVNRSEESCSPYTLPQDTEIARRRSARRRAHVTAAHPVTADWSLQSQSPANVPEVLENDASEPPSRTRLAMSSAFACFVYGVVKFAM